MNVEDKLHLLSTVVSVENQKHGTYIKLQNKSKFYKYQIALTVSHFLSNSSNLSHTKLRNFKANFIEISKLQVMAIAQLLVSQCGGSVSSSLTKSKSKSKSSVNSSTLHLPHLISPNFLGFQAQSPLRHKDHFASLPDSSQFLNGGKFCVFSCFDYKL